MIKAVVFDMFETLVTLFEGKTYFGENIATDAGVDPVQFRKEWNEVVSSRCKNIKMILDVVEE